MAEFLLCCAACGREYDGTAAFRLQCDGELDGSHGPALLVARYERRQITVRSELPGIFRFADWLPTGPYYLKAEHGSLGEPCCFRSEALAARLGLKNLYVGFSGYWPERGAHLVTRTFKEFEVQASLVCILQARMADFLPPLIVSSAGNTANSYSYYTYLTGLPLYLFVPESGLDNLLLPFDAHPTLIAVDGDYTDAIVLAERVAQYCGLTRDGGVLNPGRRGGMGTVVLNAVCHPEQGSQRLFDHYFQAVEVALVQSPPGRRCNFCLPMADLAMLQREFTWRRMNHLRRSFVLGAMVSRNFIRLLKMKPTHKYARFRLRS